MINESVLEPYSPSAACFDWAVQQQVTIYNNLEITGVLFIVGALFMLVIHEIMIEYRIKEDYAEHFVYFSKLMIYLFFFWFIFVLKLRMYYWVT